jgi:hypothetical protein
MMPEQPPLRPPHYIGNESYGWPLADCARGLIGQLASWVRDPVEFRGDARGRIWSTTRADDDHATLFFKSERGDGVIDLQRHETNWVRAELRVAGELKLRAWLEDPYEEKEFWPDGADGADEGPGRISKRGAWLQVDARRFPGVSGDPYWSVADTLW